MGKEKKSSTQSELYGVYIPILREEALKLKISSRNTVMKHLDNPQGILLRRKCSTNNTAHH